MLERSCVASPQRTVASAGTSCGGLNYPYRGWKDSMWEGGFRGHGFVHVRALLEPSAQRACSTTMSAGGSADQRSPYSLPSALH